MYILAKIESKDVTYKEMHQRMKKVQIGDPYSVGVLIGWVPKEEKTWEPCEELIVGSYYASPLGHLVQVLEIDEEEKEVVYTFKVFRPGEEPEKYTEAFYNEHYELDNGQQYLFTKAWEATQEKIASEVVLKRKAASSKKDQLLEAMRAGPVNLREYAEANDLSFANIQYYKRSLEKKHRLRKVGRGVYTVGKEELEK